MNIISVETKHITKNPFAGLVEIEGDFEPYYATIIRYTDPNEARRVLNVSGRGETKETAHQDAVEILNARLANMVNKAVSEYNAEQGVYFVDC